MLGKTILFRHSYLFLALFVCSYSYMFIWFTNGVRMFSYVFIFITSFKNYLLYIPFREFAVQLISNISLDHVDVNGQLSAVEGGTFRVRCEATTTESVSDEVKYKWTLNDTEITSPRFRIISTGNYSELSVRNTTQRDRGNLTCNATVLGESALASADIVVFSLRLIANPETVDKGSGTEVVCDLIPNTTHQLDTSFTLFRNATPFCAPETDTDTFGTHNMTWNATNVGLTAFSSCPEGFDGMVSRKCNQKGNSGVWGTANVTNCERRIFRNLIDQLENVNDGFQDVSIIKILRIYSNTTDSLNNQSSLITGDINSGVIILEKTTDIFSSKSRNISLPETEAYLSATNTLLSSDTATNLWQEVGDNNAAKVLNITSTFASVAFNSLQNNNKTLFSRPSLDVEINRNNEGNITFHAFNQPLGKDDRLFLAKESLKERTNTTGYIAIHYSTIAQLLPRKTSVDDKDITVITSVLSLALPGIDMLSLNPPLYLYFKYDQIHDEGVRCSFWDYNLEKNGFWSANGLKTVHQNSTYTECTSTHLTNFAVLLSLYEIPDNHDEYLGIITQIGCSVSIAALVVLLIIYFMEWRHVPTDKSKILVTMAVVFLLAYVIFLAGIEGTDNKVACKVVAVVLHFLFLVGIHMMVAEGIVHGKMLATVSKEPRSITPILLPIAWGIPVLIVAISMGVTKLEGYGDGKFCWLSTSNGLIWAFFAPCAVIVVINFMIFVFVVRKLFSIQAVKKQTKLQKFISGFRCFSVLAPLFGFTWTLGFFSINEDTIVLSYLFVIINSFQGLLILIVHGLLNPKIQSSWKRKISVFRKQEKFATSTKTTDEIAFDDITTLSSRRVFSSLEPTEGNLYSDLEPTEGNQYSALESTEGHMYSGLKPTEGIETES